MKTDSNLKFIDFKNLTDEKKEDLKSSIKAYETFVLNLKIKILKENLKKGIIK